MSVLMNYYRHINRDAIQFDFLYYKEYDMDFRKEIEELGGRCFLIDEPAPTFRFRRATIDFFQQHKGEFSVLHCHPIYAAVAFSSAAKKSGISRIIQHSHTTKLSERKISALRNRFLVNLLPRYVTDYAACSYAAAAVFGKQVPREQIYILNNAIDVAKFRYSSEADQQIRKELHLNNQFVIGHVGRFTAQKNQDFIVKIMSQLQDLSSRVVFLMVGEGSDVPRIQQQISSLGIQSMVCMPGRRADVDRLLSAMDLFILPSLFEGAPVSAIEAQVSGLPCILSDQITKEVNFYSTVYLPITSPNRWADEIRSAMTRSSPSRDVKNLAINAGFDILTEANKLQNYYLL